MTLQLPPRTLFSFTIIFIYLSSNTLTSAQKATFHLSNLNDVLPTQITGENESDCPPDIIAKGCLEPTEPVAGAFVKMDDAICLRHKVATYRCWSNLRIALKRTCVDGRWEWGYYEIKGAIPGNFVLETKPDCRTTPFGNGNQISTTTTTTRLQRPTTQPTPITVVVVETTDAGNLPSTIITTPKPLPQTTSEFNDTGACPPPPLVKSGRHAVKLRYPIGFTTPVVCLVDLRFAKENLTCNTDQSWTVPTCPSCIDSETGCYDITLRSEITHTIEGCKFNPKAVDKSEQHQLRTKQIANQLPVFVDGNVPLFAVGSEVAHRCKCGNKLEKTFTCERQDCDFKKGVCSFGWRMRRTGEECVQPQGNVFPSTSKSDEGYGWSMAGTFTSASGSFVALLVLGIILLLLLAIAALNSCIGVINGCIAICSCPPVAQIPEADMQLAAGITTGIVGAGILSTILFIILTINFDTTGCQTTFE